MGMRGYVRGSMFIATFLRNAVSRMWVCMLQRVTVIGVFWNGGWNNIKISSFKLEVSDIF